MAINMKLKAREDQIHSFKMEKAAMEMKVKIAQSKEGPKTESVALN